MVLHLKAVIFDLDGLVLDSESGYVTAWRQAATEMGYALDDEFCRSLSGLHGASVERRLQEHFGHDFDVQRFHRLSGEFWTAQVQRHGIPIKKGFFNVLSTVERFGLPFCLATNSSRDNTSRCLELAGLSEVFSKMITRDEVMHGKPAPDVFITAAKCLGVAVGECLVLEDSPVGVAAAVAAGAPCIYVPSVYPADNEAVACALAVLEDLDQAAGFILACQAHLFQV
ncbi:MAG: HAD family phosphatase [Methylococcaceae bacterium]|nr:HAD family phosphatase [Methylococcaceae bacterium]